MRGFGLVPGAVTWSRAELPLGQALGLPWSSGVWAHHFQLGSEQRETVHRRRWWGAGLLRAWTGQGSCMSHPWEPPLEVLCAGPGVPCEAASSEWSPVTTPYSLVWLWEAPVCFLPEKWEWNQRRLGLARAGGK